MVMVVFLYYINRAHPFIRTALFLTYLYEYVGHIPTHKISNFNPLFFLILLLFILCNLLGIRDMQEKKTHFTLHQRVLSKHKHVVASIKCNDFCFVVNKV